MSSHFTSLILSPGPQGCVMRGREGGREGGREEECFVANHVDVTSCDFLCGWPLLPMLLAKCWQGQSDVVLLLGSHCGS